MMEIHSNPPILYYGFKHTRFMRKHTSFGGRLTTFGNNQNNTALEYSIHTKYKAICLFSDDMLQKFHANHSMRLRTPHEYTVCPNKKETRFISEISSLPRKI